MKKPNFIIVYCDDLGYGDLGCYGSETAKTPNLDMLAEEGIRFTHWYSNSPVCSPSRASLLTGCYPARTGVDQIIAGNRGAAGLTKRHRTLAARLQSNGYRTALFGKWHLGSQAENLPNAHGFDEFLGFHSGVIDYYSHINYWIQRKGMDPVHDLWNNGKEMWSNGRYMTNLITDNACDYIRSQADDPFFLYVAYNAPHFPMHAPKEYLDRFPDLPPDRRIMAAMIAAVDDGVGSIIETLKASGKYEDTVIFFSSDNGPSTEARNWLDGKEDLYYGGSAGKLTGHKASLFEGGIREPAIMSYPNHIAGGQVSDKIGVMMDIVPTFMEWAGAPLAHESEVDGRSVAAMAAVDADSPHDKVYWEYDGQLAVRQGKWKLVLNGKLDFDRTAKASVHLSDIELDPGEKVNLAERNPELTLQMANDVKAWYEEMTAAQTK
ncbi:sulfatase-like hydrolase/transferase [Paenibacillus sp. HB172176]|uniref:sulfatase-like hydrolase/transferase n=1 Tax=Paenibacillus sp. HB172176 TaxID=2493690 RepID=UPI001438DA7D|nr:sulfatase-like hydrolase/transferase [Paenibacillus sp. HB172176]